MLRFGYSDILIKSCFEAQDYLQLECIPKCKKCTKMQRTKLQKKNQICLKSVNVPLSEFELN